MKAYTKGRDILLSFDTDIRKVLQQVHDDAYENYVHFAKADQIIRQEISSTSTTFSGSFARETVKKELSQIHYKC